MYSAPTAQARLRWALRCQVAVGWWAVLPHAHWRAWGRVCSWLVASWPELWGGGQLTSNAAMREPVAIVWPPHLRGWTALVQGVCNLHLILPCSSCWGV